MRTFIEFREDKKTKLLEAEKGASKSLPDEKVWKKWRSLVNMDVKAISDYYNSEEGKTSGMKQKDADKIGIDTGRESAAMLIKMIPIGTTFTKAEHNWTASMWEWCRKQNSFISRMKGARKRIKGNPFEDESGEKTRWLKSLLIWGHDPKKELRKV